MSPNNNLALAPDSVPGFVVGGDDIVHALGKSREIKGKSLCRQFDSDPGHNIFANKLNL